MRRRHFDRGPRAIDPASGFEVPLSNLVRQWDGEMVDRRFVDRRNPQDFVRGIVEDMALPFARPEVPDVFMAQPILWEDGRIMIDEDGRTILGEGEVVVL